MKQFSLFLLFILFSQTIHCQEPIFGSVLIDEGNGISIGSANTTRNIVADNDGTIYVAYYNRSGIYVSKSTNRGKTFSTPRKISDMSSPPEISVNDKGMVFIAWINRNRIYLTKSNKNVTSFEMPRIIYEPIHVSIEVHMTTFGDNVYITDKAGDLALSNSNNGIGEFHLVDLVSSTGEDFFVYADVLVNQNGTVFIPTDDPNLYLFVSDDQGVEFKEVFLSPGDEKVYYSSYALSDGPCGNYIFVSGGDRAGYRISLPDGQTTPIDFGFNSTEPIINSEGRTLYADNQGTLIDGYSNNGKLFISVSDDQGDTFKDPILIAEGSSHNVARNPFNSDIMVVYESNNRVYVNIYDDLLKGVSIEKPKINQCNSTFELPFNVSDNFPPDTEFTAYISDKNGDFGSQQIIGSTTTNQDGSISCILPNNIETSESYKIKVSAEEFCLQSNIISYDYISLGEFETKEVILCENTSEINHDLSVYNSHYESQNENVIVSYHESEAKAEANEDPIQNITVSETEQNVFVRLSSKQNEDCFEITGLTVMIVDITPIEEELLICPGETLTLFDDTPITEPGLYTKLDTISNCVRRTSYVVGFSEVHLPNAFSPNHSIGRNDEFKPLISSDCTIDFRSYHLSIWNRYGQQIFTSSNFDVGWDGTINNEPAQSGYYYWRITYSFNGVSRNLSGGVTLLN